MIPFLVIDAERASFTRPIAVPAMTTASSPIDSDASGRFIGRGSPELSWVASRGVSRREVEVWQAPMTHSIVVRSVTRRSPPKLVRADGDTFELMQGEPRMMQPDDVLLLADGALKFSLRYLCAATPSEPLSGFEAASVTEPLPPSCPPGAQFVRLKREAKTHSSPILQPVLLPGTSVDRCVAQDVTPHRSVPRIIEGRSSEGFLRSQRSSSRLSTTRSRGGGESHEVVDVEADQLSSKRGRYEASSVSPIQVSASHSQGLASFGSIPIFDETQSQPEASRSVGSGAAVVIHSHPPMPRRGESVASSSAESIPAATPSDPLVESARPHDESGQPLGGGETMESHDSLEMAINRLDGDNFFAAAIANVGNKPTAVPAPRGGYDADEDVFSQPTARTRNPQVHTAPPALLQLHSMRYTEPSRNAGPAPDSQVVLFDFPML